MRRGQFEASLEDAKLYPQLWRLLLGLLFTAFVFLSAATMLVAAFVWGANRINPQFVIETTAALTRIQAAAQGYGGIDTPVAVFILLITFIGLFIGPMLAAAAFHFRDPGSLFGEAGDWFAGFVTALAVLTPVYFGLVGLSFLVEGPAPNLSFSQWLRYLPFALPLIFIQTASEELLFRGYLQQQLAARFAARWIWMGLPALAFAGLHYTPGAGASLPFVLVSALIFGLIAADLVEQTGSLGAAMGLHFGNNLFGMLGIALGDTITGLALYVSPPLDDAVSSQAVGLGLSISALLLVWWLTRRLLIR
ncbi:MAG: lysostaphin resistance A-like protein [Tropicimonas sp.]|uniref:CPBP family intramembrane glutamic endopeptidase n=1 Tax=Tropicimonas sp. TaxID=2067044 RepID=UPI003A86CF10